MAAKLPDYKSLIAAGIDPRTGKPIRCIENVSKESVKKFLRLIDEQDAVNRYTWYNIPCNLTSQELERMIYYKGQLCFFYNKDLEEFYFMPYALDGTIDFYGRYNTIHPVPMTSGTTEEANKAQAEVLSAIKLNCVYGVKLPEELKEEDLTNSAVLLHDYTKQLSQTIIPRKDVNDPLIDVMSECVPYMQTSLLLGTGIQGIRVQDADQAHNVTDAASSMKNAALTQSPWIAVEGAVEFQELATGQLAKAEEYMLAMQSLDNLRLSGYGIDNGGLFEKKTHLLESEAEINGGPVGLVLQDGLQIRQNFCNIVNSIWGLGIWCDVNQNISRADTDGDGLYYEDDSDGGNTGVESDSEENTDE